MSNSILDTTKKVLGVPTEYDAFDVDILMHINTVFSTLNQLGIGPVDGFEVQDATPTWDTYLLGNPRYNMIKSYMYLRVRLLFDPPTTSYHLAALKEQVDELTWRINVLREETMWVVNEVNTGSVGSIDGGTEDG